MDERDSFRRPSQRGCDGARAFAERNAHASASADPADAALSLVRILVLPGADEDAAERLGAKIGVAPLRDECVLDPSDLVVRFDVDGVSLQRGELSMRADLASMLPRFKAGRLNRELLVRAARIKGAQVGEGPLRAVDATAGLGEDALLLAAAGFEVMLFERDPVIAALLAEACAVHESIRSLPMPRHACISWVPTASKPCRRSIRHPMWSISTLCFPNGERARQ